MSINKTQTISISTCKKVIIKFLLYNDLPSYMFKQLGHLLYRQLKRMHIGFELTDCNSWSSTVYSSALPHVAC